MINSCNRTYLSIFIKIKIKVRRISICIATTSIKQMHFNKISHAIFCKKINEIKYKEYIDEHRNNVQKAWDMVKNNNNCLKVICKFITSSSINRTIEFIDELIEKHDLSKYKEEEFEPYRKNFFPVSEEEKESNKEAFEEAWKHHYHKNLHHWDWWHETGNKENMPFTYIVEMVCDWIAMGFKFNNTAIEWYENNKDKIYLVKTPEKIKLYKTIYSNGKGS